MSHLSDEQLSARLDAHESRDDDATARHLADCAECRERLASLAGFDADLKGALAHDPGEEYFASFADRVTARIAADAPAETAPAAPKVRKALFGWWNSPRALAWVGGVGAVAVVAALALVLSRDGGADRFAAQQAPSTDVGANADEGGRGGGAEQATPTPAESAPPGLAVRGESMEREAEPAPKSSAPAVRTEATPAGPVAASKRAPEALRVAGDEPAARVPTPGSNVPPARRAEPAPSTSGSTTARPAKPTIAEPLAATAPSPTPPAPSPVAVAKTPVAQSSNAARDAARDAATPAPKPIEPAAPAVPENAAPKASRFDVARLFEKAKSATSAPATGGAPQSSTQGFSAPATETKETPAPATSLAPPASGGRMAGRAGAPGVRSSGYEFAATRARELENVARRERTAGAWERAGSVWSNAAEMAPDAAAARIARRAAAEALASAWRLEPTEARRATARAAVREWLAVAEPGAPQDAARQLETELTR